MVVGSALCQRDENGDKLCDTMGSVDTSNCGNHAQLVLHYVFSFGIGFFGGSSICISWINLIKVYYSLYYFSQSAIVFILLVFCL